MMEFKSRIISSLEKVFCDQPLAAEAIRSSSALQGEIYSFQTAYFCDCKIDFAIQIDSPLRNLITVREVEYVPLLLPAGISQPEHVLRTTSGLYPDPLSAVSNSARALPRQWHALWLTVRIPEDYSAGCYDIEIRFMHEGNNIPLELKLDVTEKFNLRILPVKLPAKNL